MATTTKKPTSRQTTAKKAPAKKVESKHEMLLPDEIEKPEAMQQEAPQAAYTAEQVQEMLAMAKMQGAQEAMANAPQQETKYVRISTETEKVLFLWQAEVSDFNVVEFGDNGMYGRVTGKTGMFYVPKSELSRVLTSQTRNYIDMRWLIVVSGLDDEEREALNCLYRPGELLDKKAFSTIVQLGDEILNVYPSLCEKHKEMVAMRYLQAYESGDTHVTRDIVVKLNEMSKQDGKGRGAFIAIIEAMNKRDAAL